MMVLEKKLVNYTFEQIRKTNSVKCSTFNQSLTTGYLLPSSYVIILASKHSTAAQSDRSLSSQQR